MVVLRRRFHEFVFFEMVSSCLYVRIIITQRTPHNVVSNDWSSSSDFFVSFVNFVVHDDSSITRVLLTTCPAVLTTRLPKARTGEPSMAPWFGAKRDPVMRASTHPTKI